MRISDWSSDVCSSDLRLAERRATIAGNLSGGEQQMLAIGAALLTQPRILIIDEPTLGLAVPVIEAICEKLSQLRKMLDSVDVNNDVRFFMRRALLFPVAPRVFFPG